MVDLLMYFLVVSKAVIDVNGNPPPLSDKERSRLQLRFFTHSTQVTNRDVQFKHRYVNWDGDCLTSPPESRYIHVDATTSVSDLALTKACTIIALMTRHMSLYVFTQISKGHGVGLFTASEGMAVYPENHHLQDTPECADRCDDTCSKTCTFDGRKWSTMSGLTNSRSAVLDDNVLCNADDPYQSQDNILVHEFAHQVHRYMPSKYKRKIERIYKYVKSKGLWSTPCYGMADAHEYWSEATSAFFMTASRQGYNSPMCGMNECNFKNLCTSELAARKWLRKHDRHIFKLLSKVYTNKRPGIQSGLKICQ